MKGFQLMLQNLAVAGLIHDVMETVVQLRQLLQMPFFSVELRQVDILLHLIHLLLGDVLRSPAGAQPLQAGADHVDVLHILLRDACNIGALVGDDLDQSLQLQLPECLPHRRAADPHLLADRHLLQLLMLRVFPAEDIVPQLVEHAAPQGVLVSDLLPYVITSHFLLL